MEIFEEMKREQALGPKPEGAKMRFSQFVLNEIAEGKIFRYFGLMNDRVGIIRNNVVTDEWREDRKPFQTVHWNGIKGTRGDDDWIAIPRSRGFLALFPSWNIYRGEERYRVLVRGEEAWELYRALWKLEAQLSASNKKAKLERKKREERAAWWP